jgi:hypothetical protein
LIIGRYEAPLSIVIIIRGYPRLQPSHNDDDGSIGNGGRFFISKNKVGSHTFYAEVFSLKRAGHTSGVRSDQFTAITTEVTDTTFQRYFMATLLQSIGELRSIHIVSQFK